MRSIAFEEGLYAVLALLISVAVVAIALAVLSCEADGRCTIGGAVIGVRHLGAVTSGSGLLISAVALSGRVGRRTPPT